MGHPRPRISFGGEQVAVTLPWRRCSDTSSLYSGKYRVAAPVGFLEMSCNLSLVPAAPPPNLLLKAVPAIITTFVKPHYKTVQPTHHMSHRHTLPWLRIPFAARRHPLSPGRLFFFWALPNGPLHIAGLLPRAHGPSQNWICPFFFFFSFVLSYPTTWAHATACPNLALTPSTMRSLA